MKNESKGNEKAPLRLCNEIELKIERDEKLFKSRFYSFAIFILLFIENGKMLIEIYDEKLLHMIQIYFLRFQHTLLSFCFAYIANE